jgi:2-oxoisovalerate dehydrogenase E2 component (dihydrolipoyl transacylase)
MSKTLSSISNFLVPDLGEGLQEVSIVEWLVPLGGSVEINAPLCVVETAKATVEIPSPYEGKLVRQGGAEGDTLEVGSLLVSIQITAVEAHLQSEPPEQPREAAGASQGRVQTLVGYGPDLKQDRSSRRARESSSLLALGGAAEASLPTEFAPSLQPGAAVPLAKPPVRLLARSLGVDLAGIAPGSGMGGIITRDDVLAAAPDAQTTPERPPVENLKDPTRHASARGQDEEHVPDPESTVVPVRGVRLRMAERMAASHNRIPDAACSVTADCEALLDLRVRLNEAAERAGLPTVITPFAIMARLVVHALSSHPMLNSTFVDEGPAIKLHRSIHLGIATATDRGLLVPVVKSAQSMSTLALSLEIARLTEAARAGSALSAELTGSTFTISNFGALSLDEGIPIINYPEAAILGIGSIKPRPVVSMREIIARPTATLTCVFDHRVADGAEAAAFLHEFASLVEEPDMVLLRA